MTKVYIVTSGEYSDYRIDAVFSTRELAEKYPGERIEEFDLDVPFERHDFVKVLMDKNGDTYNLVYHRSSLTTRVVFGPYYINKTYLDNTSPKILVMEVETNSDERAIKVVNEKRIQILAADCWGDDDKTIELFKKTHKDE